MTKPERSEQSEQEHYPLDPAPEGEPSERRIFAGLAVLGVVAVLGGVEIQPLGTQTWGRNQIAWAKVLRQTTRWIKFWT